MKGIEPSYSAWKAAALPLSYTRAAPTLPTLERRSMEKSASVGLHSFSFAPLTNVNLFREGCEKRLAWRLHAC